MTSDLTIPLLDMYPLDLHMGTKMFAQGCLLQVIVMKAYKRFSVHP